MADSKYSDDAILIYSSRCPHANRRRARECLACIEDVLDRVRAQSNPSPAAPAADPREVCATAIEAGRCDKSKRGYDCCEDGCRALDDAADTIRSLPPFAAPRSDAAFAELVRACESCFDEDGNPPTPNTSRAVAIYKDISAATYAAARELEARKGAK